MKQRQKKWNKPLACVLSVAAFAGGLTPVLASGDDKAEKGKKASGAQVDQAYKIVFGDDGEGYTRYKLKELLENEALFHLLLSTRADDLYLVIEERNFAMKLTSAIERYEDDWVELFSRYDGEIYVEVRFDEEKGFVKLEQEIKGDVCYITGKVAEDVDKVVIIQPSGGKIEIVNLKDRKFHVSFPATNNADDHYVILEAYVDGELVETEKLTVSKDDSVTDDVLIYTLGLYDRSNQTVRVKGIVSAKADQVYVRYGDVEKKAKRNIVWEGVASFSATFAADPDIKRGEALVTAYQDHKKVDEQRVHLLLVSQPDDDADEQLNEAYKIEGTAAISPRNKLVRVTGKISGKADDWNDRDGDWRLIVTTPDGVRHELALADDLTFDAALPFKNRSRSAKAVHVELYQGNTLVAETDLAHGVPNNNLDVKRDEDSEEKGKPKGKKKIKPGKYDDDDDDD